MLAEEAQLLGKDPEDGGMEQGIEVGSHVAADGAGQAVILGIHHGGQGVEALKEGQGTGVHGAGLAVVHQQDEGHVLVHDLEGAVEELAGVEGTGVNPLHLHHQADGSGVGNLSGSAGGHDIHHGSVRVLGGKLLSGFPGGLGAVFGQLENLVKARQHLLVLVIALGLLKNFQSQSHNIAHLLQLGGVVGLEAVDDGEISLLGQGGTGGVGDGNDSGTSGFGDRVGLDRLGGVAAQGGRDDHRVLTQPVGSIVVELSGGVVVGAELLGNTGQEVLAGVQLALGSAAANEGHILDGAAGGNLGNDVLDLAHVDVVHNKFPPDMFSYCWVERECMNGSCIRPGCAGH